VSALQRRLARLEDVLLPKPRPSVCMLTEPASDAPVEAWAEYRRQVDEAKARGDFVILLVPMKPAKAENREGRDLLRQRIQGAACCGVDASVGAWQRQPAGRRAQGCDGQRAIR
jgi:hypothetical protein